MAVPTINNLGKKVLKKICEDSFVNTLNTTGDTKAMNEIMIPNKVDAKKLIITQLP
jgi:UDP-glucose 4-epimerase